MVCYGLLLAQTLRWSFFVGTLKLLILRELAAPAPLLRCSVQDPPRSKRDPVPLPPLSTHSFPKIQVLSIKKVEVFFTTNELVKLNKDLQQAPRQERLALTHLMDEAWT